MDLISLLVVLIVLSLVFVLAWQYLAPMIPQPFQTPVRIIIILVAILMLLSLVGIVPVPLNIRVGR